MFYTTSSHWLVFILKNIGIIIAYKLKCCVKRHFVLSSLSLCAVIVSYVIITQTQRLFLLKLYIIFLNIYKTQLVSFFLLALEKLRFAWNVNNWHKLNICFHFSCTASGDSLLIQSKNIDFFQCCTIYTCIYIHIHGYKFCII